jgi:hypothetical protein
MRAALLVALAGCYSPALPMAMDSAPPDAPRPPDATSPNDGPPVVANGGTAGMDALDCPALPACDTQVMFVCGGRCQVLCQTKSSQDQATLGCLGWSGYLAVIDSAAEDSCVKDELGSDLAWIGLVQGPSAVNPGDDWVWVRASTYFEGWSGTEPNDGDGSENLAEQCAIASNAGWADRGCSDALFFLCERD